LTPPAQFRSSIDAEIGIISLYLAAHDIQAWWLKRPAMDAAFSAGAYDLLILDLNLPGEDFMYLRRVRSRTHPYMRRSRRTSTNIGLGSGPTITSSSLSIRANCWRASACGRLKSTPSTGARNGVSFLGLARRWVRRAMRHKVAMTGAEFDLLHAFCENPHRVLTRDN
jgi:two-component system OmpR family response regulator